MIHKAWSSIEEMPYCFARSSVKFQGRTALKIVEFDPDWAFPDCNSSLNSLMGMKCCTKLETAKKRCPIVFQGHPSNFKVTRDKTSPIVTQIGRFRTIGRSQLSNPSDLPCFSIVYFFFSTLQQGCRSQGKINHGIDPSSMWFSKKKFMYTVQAQNIYMDMFLSFGVFTLSVSCGFMWVFTHIPQGYFIGTSTILWMSQRHWSYPERCG